MYYVSTKASFDSAHFLAGHSGKCSNLHGHRWDVEVTLFSESVHESGSERGMVCDFSDVKEALRHMADGFDHTFIYEKGTLPDGLIEMMKEQGFVLTEVDFRPTAENFAKHFYDRIKAGGFDVASVTVWETPDNAATYEE